MNVLELATSVPCDVRSNNIADAALYFQPNRGQSAIGAFGCETIIHPTACTKNYGGRIQGCGPRNFLAGQEGLEPPTPGFGVRCSTNSSYWPNTSNY